MPSPLTLADLSDSAETKVARAVVALLRGGQFYDRDGQLQSDAFFKDAFRPIVLLEITDRRINEFGQGKLAVIPGVSKQEGHPGSRVTLKIPIYVVAYLPAENTSEDSKCNASNVGGRLRQLIWSAQVLQSGSERITYATVDFSWTDARVPPSSGTLVSTYRAIYETSIDPTTGEFLS